MIPWICSKRSKKHKEYISEAAGPHSIAFKPTLRWHRGSSNPAEPTMSVSCKIWPQGPLAVALPSLLSAREKRCPQTPSKLRCFWLSHFFDLVDQDGSTWPNISPKTRASWPNIAPRWPNMARKLGPHSPKMGQHSPKMGQHSSKTGQHSP